MKSQNRQNLKKTPWFSGVNPLRSRPGWYEGTWLYYTGGAIATLMHWDGEEWLIDGKPAYNPFLWRGVAR